MLIGPQTHQAPPRAGLPPIWPPPGHLRRPSPLSRRAHRRRPPNAAERHWTAMATAPSSFQSPSTAIPTSLEALIAAGEALPPAKPSIFSPPLHGRRNPNPSEMPKAMPRLETQAKLFKELKSAGFKLASYHAELPEPGHHPKHHGRSPPLIVTYPPCLPLLQAVLPIIAGSGDDARRPSSSTIDARSRISSPLSPSTVPEAEPSNCLQGLLLYLPPTSAQRRRQALHLCPSPSTITLLPILTWPPSSKHIQNRHPPPSSAVTRDHPKLLHHLLLPNFFTML